MVGVEEDDELEDELELELEEESELELEELLLDESDVGVDEGGGVTEDGGGETDEGGGVGVSDAESVVVTSTDVGRFDGMPSLAASAIPSAHSPTSQGKPLTVAGVEEPAGRGRRQPACEADSVGVYSTCVHEQKECQGREGEREGTGEGTHGLGTCGKADTGDEG